MTESLGVILKGDVFSSDTATSPVRLFVDIENSEGDMLLHIRRAYGERNMILTLNLADVEAALALLKTEANRTG